MIHSPPPSGGAQSSEKDGAHTHADTRRSGVGAVVLHHTVTALMIILILSLGIWSYLSFRNTGFFQQPDLSESFRLEDHAAAAQKQRLEFALEVFQRLDGRYPMNLEELVERNLILPSDLGYPPSPGDQKARFIYRRDADTYTLTWTRSAEETAPPAPKF